MGFFEDTFTVGADELLDAHTPDVGTSWTKLFQDASGPSWTVRNTNDACLVTTNVNDLGVIYTADATYPSADYDITFTLVAHSGTGARHWGVAVRVQDIENMYAVRLRNAAGACQLYKKVSGTWTAVGSTFDGPANGSVCKLEIIGTALKFYDDGAEVASATVSDISGAGKAALWAGGGTEMPVSTDDANSITEVDNWVVTDLGAGGGGEPVLETANPWYAFAQQ